MTGERDPLTECPYCEGTGYRCCGHYVGGNFPDEPPECCGQYDFCSWCDENDKSRVSVAPSAAKKPSDLDLPF